MYSAPEAGTDDLEAERDHWRTLLEVTNAVVTKRDLAGLRAAIAPNVRRIVPHDHTNLYLIDEHRAPAVVRHRSDGAAWPEHLAASIHLDANRTNRGCHARRIWTSTTRGSDRLGSTARARRGLRREADLQCAAIGSSPASSACCRSGRLTPIPFTQDELDRVTQVAAQIAIALENAMAFEEIAALKEQLARENVYCRKRSAAPTSSKRSSARARRCSGSWTKSAPSPRRTRRCCCSARPEPARNCSRARCTPRATAAAARS